MLVRSGQTASACRAVIWLHLFAASNLVACFGFQLCMGPKCLSCWPLFAVCLGHGHRISRWLNTFENTSIVYSYTDSIPLKRPSRPRICERVSRGRKLVAAMATSRWASWSLSAKTHVPSLCGSRRGKRLYYQSNIELKLKHTQSHTHMTYMCIHNIKIH